ncbi:MAG: acyltransferase family protein [Mogibacterium sp.]|nr:acyltransferase family protein [Mogibacterium sp.]MBR2539221.1 acyltransferase family protein [Mogibacterium sp.]
MKARIYKYDNVKAFLIFLVVIGHMTTDYVSDSHMVRWITLWIYTFHMPAFIFISGLVHKHYITEEKAALGVRGETRLRADKVWGFFLCGYGLKLFLQLTRTLMGQNPLWHTIAEPGIPWYLFVMAEYELLFYLMRKLDDHIRPGYMLAGAFALSSIVGYFPVIGDTFCLSRMINFLPIYMIGYYMDMKKVLPIFESRRAKRAGWVVIAASLVICCMGKWSMYSWRKWFTGRRSYEFLGDFFEHTLQNGWWIRLCVWAVAIILTIAIVSVIPDKDLGYITTIGARTLNIYFWHRPVCYLFRNWKVLPNLVMLFGGSYNAAVAGQVRGLAFGGSTFSMLAGLIVYCLIGALMTAFFGMKIFEHPTKELMDLGAKIAAKITALRSKEQQA